jgi:hypothetical protein
MTENNKLFATNLSIIHPEFAPLPEPPKKNKNNENNEKNKHLDNYLFDIDQPSSPLSLDIGDESSLEYSGDSIIK